MAKRRTKVNGRKPTNGSSGLLKAYEALLCDGFFPPVMQGLRKVGSFALPKDVATTLLPLIEEEMVSRGIVGLLGRMIMPKGSGMLDVVIAKTTEDLVEFHNVFRDFWEGTIDELEASSRLGILFGYDEAAIDQYLTNDFHIPNEDSKVGCSSFEEWVEFGQPLGWKG